MASTRRIGKHATTVSRDSEGILRVTYHATPVVSLFRSGRIDLAHGGYMSATTKLRMNQASNELSLGFHVWQKNYAWYVDIDGHTIEFDRPSITIRNGRPLL